MWAILVSGMVLFVGYCGHEDFVDVGHSCEWDDSVCLRILCVGGYCGCGPFL